MTVLLGVTAVLQYLESACKDVHLPKRGRGNRGFNRLLEHLKSAFQLEGVCSLKYSKHKRGVSLWFQWIDR